MKINIADLPPAYQAQVKSQLNAQQDQPQPQPQPESATAQTKTGKAYRTCVKRRQPNKTESEYNQQYLHGKGRYEAITFRLAGGSRYTPDWISVDRYGITAHEVKGSFRFGSHGRARTAFREAVAAFPEFGFVWATKKKDGTWEIERHV